MASEPYCAEAPPVTTSVRSTSIEGISVRSTAPPSVVGTTRRVSMSVSVRVPKNGFRPRRFASCAPTLKLPIPTFVSVKKGVFCGSVRTTSPTLTRPRFSICWESMVVSGCDESKPLRLTREPVTMISSCAAEGGCCAIAGSAADTATASKLKEPRRAASNRALAAKLVMAIPLLHQSLILVPTESRWTLESLTKRRSFHLLVVLRVASKTANHAQGSRQIVAAARLLLESPMIRHAKGELHVQGQTASRQAKTSERRRRPRQKLG